MLKDNNPQSWKLLVFYFNRSEPRLWVPKRFGLGYTMNLARDTAWAIMAILLATVIVLAVHNN